MESNWWKEVVVYQIYPRSFNDSNGDGIGDLKGITQKIPYLKSLGVNAIWISPYFKSPNDDNGYDISDYRDIMEDFGTMSDWTEMITEMHKNNIKLIMDLVVNHSSDEHQWFIDSKNSILHSESNAVSDKRDYYIWRKGKNNGELPPNNWMSFFGGPAWERADKSSEYYYLHLFSKKQPDLNWDNPKLREEIYDMMRFWCDKGVDGFRLDAIANISKKQTFPDGDPTFGSVGIEHFINGPRVHEFIHEMNKEVFSKYDLMTVGECFSTNIAEALKYVSKDRKELNMIFQFNIMDIDADPKKGKWEPGKWKLSEMKGFYRNWQHTLEDGNGWNSNFLSNHDFPRHISRFGSDETNEFRKLSAKMLATLNFTLQGTTYIYQGEEIGMTNVKFDSINDYKDIETLNFFKENVDSGKISKEHALNAIHRTSRDNARTPMQWNSSKNAGFTSGEPWIKLNPNYTEINVEESLNSKDSIWQYYKQLIELRKEEKDVFVYGHFEDYFPEDEKTFIYTRTNENKIMLVCLNFTKENQELKIPENIKTDKIKLLISNYANDSTSISQILRPYEALVYLL